MTFKKFFGFTFGIAHDEYPTWVLCFAPFGKAWVTLMHQAHFVVDVFGAVISRNGIVWNHKEA